MRAEEAPVVLIAAMGLLLALFAAGYVGWRLGREQGICEVGCEEATAGTGEATYRGGTCRCAVNGEEVHPL
jgi:hypothetical protein